MVSLHLHQIIYLLKNISFYGSPVFLMSNFEQCTNQLSCQLLRIFTRHMTHFHPFQITLTLKDTSKCALFQDIPSSHSVFLNLVYAFTKVPLIRLKIVILKPLFICILHPHTNAYFLQFLKHRQSIYINTTRICILHCSITSGVVFI